MVAAAVCAAIVGVGAAQPEANKTVTVTGCVQNISSTSPAGETVRGFLLSNVLIDDPGAGTPTKGRPKETSTSYVLDGRGGDLKAQVGHKVEVTGTLSSQLDSATAPSAAASLAGGVSARSMDRQQRLEVSSVRKVASDCLSK
jgi:hypothetical protein